MQRKNINVSLALVRHRWTFTMKNEDNSAKASEHTASANSADNCTGGPYKSVQRTETPKAHWVCKSLLAEPVGGLHITIVRDMWFLVPPWASKGMCMHGLKRLRTPNLIRQEVSWWRVPCSPEAELGSKKSLCWPMLWISGPLQVLLLGEALRWDCRCKGDFLHSVLWQMLSVS